MARDDTPDKQPDRLPADWPERRPGAFEADRERMLSEFRDVRFPVAMRGYDRDAVDDYVVRVNQALAELEATRSPDSAVRRALERVGEETSGILQRANETAEQITRRSRAQADDRLQAAEQEAAALLQQAEARVREVETELDAFWNERERLIEVTRGVAHQLLDIAESAASDEPPHPEVAEAEDTAQLAAVEPGDSESPGDATEEPSTPAGPVDAQPAPEVPGHPDLEPEPPDRESPDEGIIRVEPMEAGAEDATSHADEEPPEADTPSDSASAPSTPPPDRP